VAYGFVMDVQAPIEFYDAMHAEIGRRTAAAGGVDGMLVHVGRETRNGFQITEVWETKELYDRFNAEIIGPALAELSGGQPPPQEPVVEEFEPRGLVVPAAHVAV
jgi:hypothetical protein